jgi:hypothetical protein
MMDKPIRTALAQYLHVNCQCPSNTLGLHSVPCVFANPPVEWVRGTADVLDERLQALEERVKALEKLQESRGL